MSRLPLLVAAAMSATSGAYTIIYLYRWEWNRALLMASFFIAAEVAIATALVLRAVRRLGHELRDERLRSEPDPAVLTRIREAAPRRDHFAWLGVRGDRLNVFVTMMVGGGVLVSGVAWVVDRVARHTGGRGLESDLARQLTTIAFPDDGLVADETELLAEDAPYERDAELQILLGTPSAR